MKGGEGNEPKKTGARSFLQPRWLRYIQKSLAPHEDSESGSSGCVVLMSLGLHTGDVESRFHICFSQDEPQRELTVLLKVGGSTLKLIIISDCIYC